MKVLNIIRFLVFASLAVSCKKDPLKHNRYSTWSVNGEQFRNNNVEVYDDGRSGNASLTCRDSRGKFWVGFAGVGLPTAGSWLLSYNGGINFRGIEFWLDTSYYVLSPHTTNGLTATEDDGKASYHMPPTWFHYYWDRADSVLIEGTFNEP